MEVTKIGVLMVIGTIPLIAAAAIGFSGDIILCSFFCILAFICMLYAENIRTRREE